MPIFWKNMPAPIPVRERPLRTLLGNLLLAVLLPVGALAESGPDSNAACAGKNLLKALEQDHPEQARSLKKTASEVPNSQSLAFEITAPGSGKTSLIIGTMHVSDPRIMAHVAALAPRIDKASVAVFEVKEIGDAAALGLAALSQAHKMMMPAGQTLWDVIPDDQEALVRNYPALQPDLIKTIDNYQPWVVQTLLMVTPCERARTAAQQPSFDGALAQRAAAAGVPVEGLETVVGQMDILSADPVEVQGQDLLTEVKSPLAGADVFETMLALYEAQNMALVMPLMEALENRSPSAEELKSTKAFEERILNQRNEGMAAASQPWLDAGNAFIAVGALHLPGPGGIIARLQKAGYGVKAMPQMFATP